MKLSDFKLMIDQFVENECSMQPDGRILMGSHGYEVQIDFYGDDGEELPPPRLVFSQFIGCGCVCGADIHFTTKTDEELY